MNVVSPSSSCLTTPGARLLALLKGQPGITFTSARRQLGEDGQEPTQDEFNRAYQAVNGKQPEVFKKPVRQRDDAFVKKCPSCCGPEPFCHTCQKCNACCKCPAPTPDPDSVTRSRPRKKPDRVFDWQVVLKAAAGLTSPFGLAALVLASWRSDKVRFGLKGCESVHPSEAAVRACLWGTKGLLTRKLLAKLGKDRYEVTQAGKDCGKAC